MLAREMEDRNGRFLAVAVLRVGVGSPLGNWQVSWLLGLLLVFWLFEFGGTWCSGAGSGSGSSEL